MSVGKFELSFLTFLFNTCHTVASTESPKEASRSSKKREKHSKHTTGKFSHNFDFNVCLAENGRLFLDFLSDGKQSIKLQTKDQNTTPFSPCPHSIFIRHIP